MVRSPGMPVSALDTIFLGKRNLPCPRDEHFRRVRAPAEIGPLGEFSHAGIRPSPTEAGLRARHTVTAAAMSRVPGIQEFCGHHPPKEEHLIGS